MSGLTETGFETPTIDDIVDEISADIKANLDNRADTTPTSVLGQLVGLFAEREKKAYEMGRDVWAAFTPGGASGQSLAQLSLLTGTKKRSKTKSRVTVTVNLDAGTTLDAGSQVNVVDNPKIVFELVDAYTNAGLVPDDFDLVFEAVNAGAVRANAGTLTAIATPTSGWNSATNAEDAEIGLEDESDTDLRTRREVEIRQQGSGAIDAMVADVLEVSGVIDVKGFENTLDEDAGLLEPHSFLIVIWDGDPTAADDVAIAQAIWDAKPCGIKPLGGTTAAATDRQGGLRLMAFDRATGKDVYLEVDLVTDDEYPADGDTQVKDAILAYADTKWKIGNDVIVSALYVPIFSVDGVVSVTAIRAGFTVSPVDSDDLTIGNTEIALGDSARIIVNS